MRSIKSSPIPDAINPNPSVKQEDILAEDLKTCHQVMALVSSLSFAYWRCSMARKLLVVGRGVLGGEAESSKDFGGLSSEEG